MSDSSVDLEQGYELRIETNPEGKTNYSFYKDGQKIDARTPRQKEDWATAQRLAEKRGLLAVASSYDGGVNVSHSGMPLNPRTAYQITNDIKGKLGTLRSTASAAQATLGIASGGSSDPAIRDANNALTNALEKGQSTGIAAGSRIKLGQSPDAPIYIVVNSTDNPPSMSLELINRAQGYPQKLEYIGQPLTIGGLGSPSSGTSPYEAVIDFNDRTQTFTLNCRQQQRLYVFTPNKEQLIQLREENERLWEDLGVHADDIKDVTRLSVDTPLRASLAQGYRPEELSRFFPDQSGRVGYAARDGARSSATARGQIFMNDAFAHAQEGFLTEAQKLKLAKANRALETIQTSATMIESPKYGSMNLADLDEATRAAFDAETRARNATSFVMEEFEHKGQVYFSEDIPGHHKVGMVEKVGDNYFYSVYNGGLEAQRAGVNTETGEKEVYTIERYKLDVNTDDELRGFLQSKFDRIVEPPSAFDVTTGGQVPNPRYWEAKTASEGLLGEKVSTKWGAPQHRGNCTYNSNELAVSEIIDDPELSSAIRKFGENPFEHQLGAIDPAFVKGFGKWYGPDRLPNPELEQTAQRNYNLLSRAAYDQLLGSVDAQRESLINQSRALVDASRPSNGFVKNPSSLFNSAAKPASVLTDAGKNASGVVSDQVAELKGIGRQIRYGEPPPVNSEAAGLSRRVIVASIEKLGGGESMVNRVGGVLELTGKTVKVAGPIIGAVATYNAVDEYVNGNGYTQLMAANGLSGNSAAVQGYENFQEKNIAENGAMTIPTAVTQAYAATSGLLRWAVSDIDHGKLLAKVVARDRPGASRQDVREAVEDYVDSSLWYFHHFNSDVREHIIDNLMAMKETGQMQDWSQLPGVIGNDRNIGYLQRDPKGKYSSLGYINLPDAEKTRTVMQNAMARDLQNALQEEALRQKADLPDIDWQTAKQRMADFAAGSVTKEAMMGYLKTALTPPAILLITGRPSWDQAKQSFSDMLDYLDPAKDKQRIRNAWNRPLDWLTASMVNRINDAGGDEDITTPTVLDPSTGKARQLTTEELSKLRDMATMIDPATGKPRLLTSDEWENLQEKMVKTDPSLANLKLLRIDEKGQVSSDTLTPAALNDILAGNSPLAQSPDVVNSQIERIRASDIQEGRADRKQIVGVSAPVVEDAPGMEDLASITGNMANEADPGRKKDLQSNFNLAFASSGAQTQQEFISKADNSRLDALRAYVAAEEEKRKNNPDTVPPPEDDELSQIKAGIKGREQFLKYPILPTGLDLGEIDTKRGTFRISNETRRVDINRDGKDDEGDIDGEVCIITRLGDGKQFIVQTTADGRNILFNAFNINAGSRLYEPASAEDIAAIREAQEAVREKKLTLELGPAPR